MVEDGYIWGSQPGIFAESPNRNGTLIEAWTQWDKLFEGGGGPHKIRISPYDPERHVWVVNDARHQIYEFTNDGKQLVRTLGVADVAGSDARHRDRQEPARLRRGPIEPPHPDLR